MAPPLGIPEQFGHDRGDVIVRATRFRTKRGDCDDIVDLYCDSKILMQGAKFLEQRISKIYAENPSALAATKERREQLELRKQNGNKNDTTTPRVEVIIDLQEEEAFDVLRAMQFLHPPHQLSLRDDNWKLVMRIAQKLGIGNLFNMCRFYAENGIMNHDPATVVNFAWRMRWPSFFQRVSGIILYKSSTAWGDRLRGVDPILVARLEQTWSRFMLQAFEFVAHCDGILLRRECCDKPTSVEATFLEQWRKAVQNFIGNPCLSVLQALMDTASSTSSGLQCDCLKTHVAERRQALTTPLSLELSDVPTYVA